jgi:hypothetical protein
MHHGYLRPHRQELRHSHTDRSCQAVSRRVNMFRVLLEISGSARAKVFAAAPVWGTLFIATALLVGCSNIGRTNVESPAADAEIPVGEGVHETNPQAAAPSGDELQEIVTTGQHRKPPPTARPGRSSSTLTYAAAPAASAASAASVAGEAAPEPPPPEAGERPRYEARLTHPVITREHDEVLSVAISTKLSADELRELVNAHLKSAWRLPKRA